MRFKWFVFDVDNYRAPDGLNQTHQSVISDAIKKKAINSNYMEFQESIAFISQYL